MNLACSAATSSRKGEVVSSSGARASPRLLWRRAPTKARKVTAMQTDNPFLDGMARFLTNAAGAAQAFKAEMETMMKGRIERMIADLEFVPRDEFEAVKAMAAKARAENERSEERRVGEGGSGLGSE